MNQFLLSCIREGQIEGQVSENFAKSPFKGGLTQQLGDAIAPRPSYRYGRSLANDIRLHGVFGSRSDAIAS
jgi:hypothetical protein